MRTTFTVLAVATAMVSPAAAQVSAPAFSLAVGYANPTGTFRSGYRAEGFKKSLTALVALRFALRGLPLAVRLDGMYSGHGANDSLLGSLRTALGTTSDEHVKMLGVNLGLLGLAPRRWRARPYLLGGAGVSRTSVALTVGSAPTTRVSRTGLAWNAGGGAFYRIKKVALSVEARLVSAAPPGGLPRITLRQLTLGLQSAPR